MPFNSHTAALAGKKGKRGKDSKVTAIRNIYAEFLDNNSNKIQTLFDKVSQDDPAKALDLLLKLSAFVIPKPQLSNEKAEADLSKVPVWLRPNGFNEMDDEEYQKKLEKAKRVIEASEW